MNTKDNIPFAITVIGNGAAIPIAGKYHSAHVLNTNNQYYLLDCGEGTQKAMLENGINPQKLKAIFISHMHGDHIYGLFPLIDTLSLSQRSQPLQVFAPAPMGRLMDSISDIMHGGHHYNIAYHEIDTEKHQQILENDDIEVWTVPLKHRVPSAGYLFREKKPGLNVRKEMVSRYSLGIDNIIAAKRGEDLQMDGVYIPNTELTYIPYTPRSYAYCTDTVYSEEISTMVKEVDILYHEASFAAADIELAKLNGHSTTTQAAQIALRAGAKKLLIGHFSARYKNPAQLVEEAQAVFADTEEAIEGRTYEIVRERTNI